MADILRRERSDDPDPGDVGPIPNTRRKTMAGGTVDRRDFLRTTTTGVLATTLGAPLVLPGRAHAAKKTLKILQWVHFVPAYDEWFNKKYTKEWGEKNDTEVIVDNIGI